MQEHKLLRSQRNDIFIAIQETDLQPSTFLWETVPSLHEGNVAVPRLIHEPSGGYYHFDLISNRHWCQYSPGNEILIESQYPGDWGNQLIYFTNSWLQYLKREFETPDLWTTIAGERAFMLGTTDVRNTTNSLFSNTEREHLSRSLNEIRAYIKTTHLVPDDRITYVEERLQYLEEAAGRMGRKDWINLAYGALINIIVGAALAPSAAKDLLRLAGSALAWLLGELPVLPLHG